MKQEKEGQIINVQIPSLAIEVEGSLHFCIEIIGLASSLQVCRYLILWSQSLGVDI